MREKLLALLALSPFGKGEAQEAKISGVDQVLPPTEEVREKPADKPLNKKTANPWKVNFETTVSLVKPETVDQGLELEKKQQENISIADYIFGYSQATNAWFKELNKTEITNGLGKNTSIWADYKQGKISAQEASAKLWFQPTSDPLVLAPSNFSPLFVLKNYFTQIGKLETYKTSAGDFAAGSVLMAEALSVVKSDNLSVDELAKKIKNIFQDLSYEKKLGALTFFSRAISVNSNHGKETPQEATGDPAVLNEMVINAVKYLQGETTTPSSLGVCRHLAAVTSDFAKNGLGLNASGITTDRHIITQIKNSNGEITLLDGDNFVNSISGHPLLTEDDVYAAAVRNFKKPPMSDVTTEAGGDGVLYNNSYNGASGLFKILKNYDNRLRGSQFIAGDNELALFPRLIEGGVTRGSIEKGNFGLQAYWLRDNNEYNAFMKDMKGLNLAAYVPADFSLGKKKFENIFFANLGFYKSVLDLAVDKGGETKTLDATASFENYLRCSLNTALTVGMITKLADFNLELNRSGEQLSGTEKFEWHGSVSPFLSFEIPGGGNKEKTSRTYLCTGLEVTDYLTLPDTRKLSTIPWFQAGFEYNKKEIDFGLKLRGEFQPASARFDLDSFLKKGNNQLELRAFSEFYTQEFQKLTPYKNAAGIEAGIRHDFENGHSLFLMLSSKSGEPLLLNIGFGF